MIKFFIKKYWRDIAIVTLAFLMFVSGFWCAWQIQGRRDNVTIQSQGKLITQQKAQLTQNAKVFKEVMIVLIMLERKIEGLERQLGRFYEDMEKITDWNGEVESN